MLYIDYRFTINEEGLTMADSHPDEMLTIDKVPFELGEKFTLQQTDDGCLFFKRQAEYQMELPFEV